MNIIHTAFLILSTSKHISSILNKTSLRNITLHTNITNNIGIQHHHITNLNNQQDDFFNDSEIFSSAQIQGYERAQKARPFRRALSRAEMNKHFEIKLKHNESSGVSAFTDIDEESSSKDSREFVKNWRLNMREFKKDALKALLVRNNNTGRMNVNMARARPWGVPCGDFNQHDVPLGTCTLPYECPPEFRIYRGDLLCKTGNRFVCCGVQRADYDLYEAIDISGKEISSMSTSSVELERKEEGSKEKKIRKRRRALKRLNKAKYRRKRKMKRTIRRLQKAIRKELNRAFRNNSRSRYKTTINLLILIAKMKKKMKNDRFVAKQQHDRDLKRIDGILQTKLDKILDLNHDFLMNDTFREAIMKGNLSPANARILIEAYPDLEPDIKGLVALTRRSGDGAIPTVKLTESQKDFIDYDIEIGELNYLNTK